MATITTLAPGDIVSRQSLTISRSRRRTLLRITAPPTRREVMMPMRAVNASSDRRIPTRKRRVWDAFPWSRTRVKSPLLRRRADLGKRRRPLLGLGVSGEVDFDTFREKPLAAVTAAAAQDGAAGPGLHAGAEAELLFARALGRLVCAFHDQSWYLDNLPLHRRCADSCELGGNTMLPAFQGPQDVRRQGVYPGFQLFSTHTTPVNQGNS